MTPTPDTVLAEHAARVAAQAQTTALCLDFDGTLAPIVDDPNQARPLPGMMELLGQLAARFAAVALLSGRPADYLAQHAAAPGVRYLGLYGLQEIRDGQLWVDPRLEAARPAVMAAQQDLRDCAAVRDSGAYLEDKQYAVAIHTRRVADPTRWAAPIDEAARQIAERHGLEVIVGKLVWELRPAVRSDKGEAVRRVTAESKARGVVVAGVCICRGTRAEGCWRRCATHRGGLRGGPTGTDRRGRSHRGWSARTAGVPQPVARLSEVEAPGGRRFALPLVHVLMIARRGPVRFLLGVLVFRLGYMVLAYLYLKTAGTRPYTSTNLTLQRGDA